MEGPSPHTRPWESYGVIDNRDGGQSVHAFFDRFENVCPRFVSRIPALLVGVIVMNLVVVLFMDAVKLEKRMHHNSSDPFLRSRWVVMFLCVLLIAGFIAYVVRDQIYLIDSIKMNKQHFANAFWLEQYTKAMGGRRF